MYSSKVRAISPGGSLVSRFERMNFFVSGEHLVRVDLVAEHQQEVGPRLGLGVAHPQRERAQRVVLAPAVVLVLGQGVRRLARRGHAAGGEGDLELLLLRVGAELRRRELVIGRRPGALPVQLHAVLVALARLEALHAHERVVVALHVEGAPARPEHGHLACRVGLHPEHRAVLADVAQQGSEDELSHVSRVPLFPNASGRPEGRPPGRPILGRSTSAWNTGNAGE